MSRSDYGSSTKDSKSRDLPVSSTAKITTITVPNILIIKTVCPSSTKGVDPLVSSTTKVATIQFQKITIILPYQTLLNSKLRL